MADKTNALDLYEFVSKRLKGGCDASFYNENIN
jgi:hypothetical protein